MDMEWIDNFLEEVREKMDKNEYINFPNAHVRGSFITQLKKSLKKHAQGSVGNEVTGLRNKDRGIMRLFGDSYKPKKNHKVMLPRESKNADKLKGNDYEGQPQE